MMTVMRDRVIRALWFTAFALAAVAVSLTPARALVIVPTFASSVTDASDAAQFEAQVIAAIDVFEGLYSNDTTVGVYFTQATNPSFNGESETVDFGLSYASYRSLLQSDSTANPANKVLSNALNYLPGGNRAPAHANDANEETPIALTDALTVALGATNQLCFDDAGNVIMACGGTSTASGVNDGVIALSNDLNYLNGDAENVIEHELDEILGGGGQGSTLNAVAFCDSNPGECVSGGLQDYMGPLDLYRYAATGSNCSTITTTGSFTTNPSATACLSVNGGASAVVQFNQNSAGDFGDFVPNSTYIQSAFSDDETKLPYTTNSPEYTMMESIGWDPVPEPASLALFGSALFGLAAMRRRRREAA